MADYHKAREITPGFFNIRTSFTRLMGMLDIGTHMSLLKLSSGRFLIIDTVELNDQSKAEIDRLTNNGKLIEAVIATHPYHTLYFPAFYRLYPNAKYYGTPRHLKVQPEIPWAGDVNEASVRKLWEPEVEMRIPEGSEFVHPLPETSNHFNNVFVFHKASRTVHVDDTILISNQPGFLMRLIGFKEGSMMFHPSMAGPGLHPTEDAPKNFICWLEKMMKDWDFDSMASAHNGYMVGGAKQLVAETLEKAKPQLAKLSKNRSQDVGSWSMDACEYPGSDKELQAEGYGKTSVEIHLTDSIVVIIPNTDIPHIEARRHAPHGCDLVVNATSSKSKDDASASATPTTIPATLVSITPFDPSRLEPGQKRKPRNSAAATAATVGTAITSEPEQFASAATTAALRPILPCTRKKADGTPESCPDKIAAVAPSGCLSNSTAALVMQAMRAPGNGAEAMVTDAGEVMMGILGTGDGGVGGDVQTYTRVPITGSDFTSNAPAFAAYNGGSVYNGGIQPSGAASLGYPVSSKYLNHHLPVNGHSMHGSHHLNGDSNPLSVSELPMNGLLPLPVSSASAIPSLNAHRHSSNVLTSSTSPPSATSGSFPSTITSFPPPSAGPSLFPPSILPIPIPQIPIPAPHLPHDEAAEKMDLVPVAGGLLPRKLLERLQAKYPNHATDEREEDGFLGEIAMHLMAADVSGAFGRV